MTDNQKMKLASIEAMWETEEAPAAITLIGLPDVEAKTTHYAIKLPYVMAVSYTHLDVYKRQEWWNRHGRALCRQQGCHHYADKGFRARSGAVWRHRCRDCAWPA